MAYSQVSQAVARIHFHIVSARHMSNYISANSHLHPSPDETRYSVINLDSGFDRQDSLKAGYKRLNQLT